MPLEFFSLKVGGQKLQGVIHLPKKVPAPVVVGSHGLFSSKDSEKFIMLGDLFSQEGIAFLRYDHRGCGESEGDISETTPSSRLEDLKGILAFVRGHPLLDASRLGLLGSSMGGFISVLEAKEDPGIKALVLWATPMRIRGKVEGPLKEAFFEDARRFDLLQAVEGLKGCLFLHGKGDEVVPFQDALELYRRAKEPKELVLFEKADHSFSELEDRKSAALLSLEWFKRFLLGPS